MQSITRLVPDAGSYAPVTVLIDQRPDGVHLSYDEMASFLAQYGNAEALKIARDLDAKVKRLLQDLSLIHILAGPSSPLPEPMIALSGWFTSPRSLPMLMKPCRASSTSTPHQSSATLKLPTGGSG